MNWRCSIVLAGVVVSTSPGWAHEITYTDHFEPQFTIWLPDEWKVTLEKERITAFSDDGMLWLIVVDMKSVSSMDDAAARIRARVDEALTAVQYQEPINVELQGMPARLVEGQGKLKGKDVVFFVMAFQHAEDRVGMLGVIGDPAVRTLYKTTIIDIATSIRPAASFYAGQETPARENPPPPNAPPGNPSSSRLQLRGIDGDGPSPAPGRPGLETLSDRLCGGGDRLTSQAGPVVVGWVGERFAPVISALPSVTARRTVVSAYVSPGTAGEAGRPRPAGTWRTSRLASMSRDGRVLVQNGPAVEPGEGQMGNVD